jgi:hypothetical protein
MHKEGYVREYGAGEIGGRWTGTTPQSAIVGDITPWASQ